MARPLKIDKELVQKAQTVAASTTDLHELREAQSILMPALYGSTLEQTASMLGVSLDISPTRLNPCRLRLLVAF